MSTVTIERKITTMTIESKLEDDPPAKGSSSTLPASDKDYSSENGDKCGTSDDVETNGESPKACSENAESEKVDADGEGEVVKENGDKSKEEDKEEESTAEATAAGAAAAAPEEKEHQEVDQAVLTSFLPGDVFECCLGDKCVLGDKTATEGK